MKISIFSATEGILVRMTDVTHILGQIDDGDPSAVEKLLPLIYDELRRLAAIQLADERTGHSLQPTALVHEAYLRLVGSPTTDEWNHRGHFYAAAAESMRRILVENARRKQTLKRGGDRARANLEMATIAQPERRKDLLALDDALIILAEQKPEIAKLVSLRYFGGLTMSQAASAMEISQRTAERHWTYARAWLLEEVNSDSSG